ncbi:MAG TPA: flagellar hook protein FlgE [Candidatus Acidoferrales bacterium]|jgi:flagellar hook protein FlgE|nr:flagellar hook protein FlgE [Candidatus Acidoferrales bacterium]
MFTSFSTALSALNATSTAIDVTGNNLANLNTPGFKASQVAFRDLVTQSLGAGLGDTQVGFGTGTPLTIREFTQGALQTSGGLLDAAIQGDGFFVLQNSQGNTTYTRAGNFQADKNGNLLTDTGDRVQGWTTLDPATGLVNTNGPIGNIIVPVGSLRPPVPTTAFTADLNLNAGATADATSNFTTPMTVVDSLGTNHVLTLNFQKTGANSWSYDVMIPGEDVSGGTAGTPVSTGATGTLTFGADGQLIDPPAGAPVSIAVAGLADGAADMSVSWGMFNGTTGRLTQFGQPSSPSASSQNGKTAGELVHVGLADGGGILAAYSNGDQVIVGQVALASIRNADTLIAAGNNAFQLSARTATPTVGIPGTGGRGSIVGGSVEASTVDIAKEFTNLIVYQRGYEANSKVVTTSDQLSQDTINLIR